MPRAAGGKVIATILVAKVDVHCVNELKGRSGGYLFAIISSGYVISGGDAAAASG
jgi:hypothetical protein